MYNIGKSLSVGTRSPNFKKLVVRKSFPELKMVRTKKKVENHCSIESAPGHHTHIKPVSLEPA
jgi:hypothetical protein